MLVPELSSTDAVGVDRFSIDDWSLSLGFHVLLKTIGCVVAGRGAY
jgi:hypothetical protein